MKEIKNILFFLFAVLVTLSACEETDNPLEGATEVNNFVQFAANTQAEVSATEGSSSTTMTIQSPISGGEDLLATISFSGDAVFGVDFDIIDGTGTTDIGGVVSKSATEAVIRVPFIPAGGVDLITDQVDFQVVYLTDGETDGDKTLVITLTGAVGSKTSSLVFDGGRGPIRVNSTISISDADCPSELTGTWDADTSGDAYVVTITETASNGLYDLSDITFGLYANGYGSSDNPVQFVDACGVISVTDQDDVVYGGDVFNATGTVNADGTISITWANGFGDSGVTTLTKQ